MSSFSKLWLVVGVVCATTFADRVSFSSGSKASLETSLSQMDSGPNDVSVKLNIPYLDLSSERDGFVGLSVEGLNPLERLGNPEVLTTGSLIAVPNGYRPVLTVTEQASKTLAGVVAKPHQAKFRCDCATDAFSFNAQMYGSNVVYPESVAQLEVVGNFHGVELYRVALNPVQVDFANRSTIVTSELSVKVHFEKVAERGITEIPSSIARVIQQSAVNGRDNSLFREVPGERMLIVAADDLKAAIAPYVDWKNESMTVDVITFGELDRSKEEVQKFIKEYYAKNKFTYLLMVGNKTTNPGFMESTSAGSAASDWKFTLLEGNDNIPDVFYGRLLADNAAEAKVQVAKWVAYEKTPESADWYHNATTIASREGSNPSDKEYAIQIADALKAGSYKQVDGFFQGDSSATGTNITNALTRGSSWLAYFGHGSGTEWGSTNDKFDNKKVETLKNTRLPVVIDVACLNASWVNIAKPFGKAWMIQQNNGVGAGAVAFYGGSVSISWHPPAVMSVGIAKSYVDKHLKTVGEAVLAGQLYLQAKMGTGKDTLDNLKWYNLFGDPNLHIRSEAL